MSLQLDNGALQSPVSDLSSPGDEFGSIGRKQGDMRHLAEAMGSCGEGGLVGGSPGTSGMGGPLAGASPPSTPDLPSPVNTVEATKSALIKEGLKLQIRSKLQAAGVDTPESLLDETKIFKDVSNDVSTGGTLAFRLTALCFRLKTPPTTLSCIP